MFVTDRVDSQQVVEVHQEVSHGFGPTRPPPPLLHLHWIYIQVHDLHFVQINYER